MGTHRCRGEQWEQRRLCFLSMGKLAMGIGGWVKKKARVACSFISPHGLGFKLGLEVCPKVHMSAQVCDILFQDLI
jgi:hypothetical protein